MSCRGVHFALTDVEVRALESREGDRAGLEYVQEEIEEKFFKNRRDDLVETDKAWDAIHRCLTDGTLSNASASPLELVVLGGRSLCSGDDYIMTPQAIRRGPHCSPTPGCRDKNEPARFLRPDRRRGLRWRPG